MATMRYRWIDGAAPPDTPATAEPTFSDVINGWAVVDDEPTRPAPDPVARPRVPARTASLVEPLTEEFQQVSQVDAGQLTQRRSAEQQDDRDAHRYRAPAARPYLWTLGRTRTSRSFSIETLVSTSARGLAEMGRLRLEHRVPAELCRRPRAVGELAALLSVPLGVARVLIDEMADLGIVVVHADAGSEGPQDLAFLKRVLDGLQRL